MLNWSLKGSQSMRVAPKIELTDEERAALTKLWRSGLTSVRLAQRARIILLADQGLNNKDIAAQLGIGR
ncbi:MAG: helix-turn-helix domain-containing protein, partial [Burkholderiaceae bacterium]